MRRLSLQVHVSSSLLWVMAATACAQGEGRFANTMGVQAAEHELSSDGRHLTVPPSEPIGVGIEPGQAYFIRAVHSGKVLDVAGQSAEAGARLQQWSKWGGTNQQFRFHEHRQGVYSITGVASSKCIDLAAGSPADGTIVQMWPCWGGTPQQWKPVPTSDNKFLLVNADTGGCLGISSSSDQDGQMAQQWSCHQEAFHQQFELVPATGKPPVPVLQGLHVGGNRLVDSSGTPVRLHGVNIPSLEWSNGEPNVRSTPPPCVAGQTVIDSVKRALAVYKVNLVRLPISQDRWWNKVDGQGASYRASIDSIVQTVADAGAYIDVDLHWSDAGVWGNNIGQHMMPDDNSAIVWADLAAHFANNPAVLFGLYNEPHDVDWITWRNGGNVSEGGLSYHTPGMQGLVDTIRKTGATNIVIAGGLNWAFDLTGISNGFALHDKNVLYDAHVYPWKGTLTDWDSHISVISENYPVLVGEFGADYSQLTSFSTPQQFIAAIQPWIHQHQYNYAAWDLHPTATPSLISDWCYTPTPYFGAVTLPWL